MELIKEEIEKLIKKRFNTVNVIGGELFPYLKDILLIGRIQKENKDFIVYGCLTGEEEKIYEGLLKYELKTGTMGFEDVQEVKAYWENDGDMLLIIENGEYEIL